MKTKLKLNDLKVTSFVTELKQNEKATVKGGNLLTWIFCQRQGNSVYATGLAECPNLTWARNCSQGDGYTCHANPACPIRQE